MKQWSSSTTTDGSGTDTDCGKGNGVTQILWSPCGQYMIVIERCTSALLVYDVRETYQLVARLVGRRIGEGNASQRLQADVYPGSPSTDGFEVWSGTGDGGLVVWEGVGLKQGDVPPTWEKTGITDGFASAVSGAVMHESGTVVATVSGSWSFADDDSDSDSESDSESGSDSSSDEDEEEKGDGEKKKEEDESKGKDKSTGNDMDISDTSSDASSDSSSSSSSAGSYHPRNGLVVKETSLKIWSIRGVNHDNGDAADGVAKEQEEGEVVDEWGRARRCDTSYGE